MSALPLDLLETAFAYHVAQRIVGADQTLDPAEVRFLRERWPQEEMQRVGLMTPAGELTTTFMDARDEAIRTLASRMSEDRKLAMMRQFLDATVVDGHLDHRESGLLVAVSRQLGLPETAFLAMLDDQDDVGELELPEPE